MSAFAVLNAESKADGKRSSWGTSGGVGILDGVLAQPVTRNQLTWSPRSPSRSPFLHMQNEKVGLTRAVVRSSGCPLEIRVG